MERGWRSGPRLPALPATPECWRCAEPELRHNKGRVLRDYALVTGGKLIGSVRLCGFCARTATPLNPDPLDATENAA